MKIRIEFSKTGVLKFIGHLDIMRYFQKAIRRSGIDIAYTEGFSPHQVMSFAAPLGVGLESESEYLDIEVRRTQNSRVSMERLNAEPLYVKRTGRGDQAVHYLLSGNSDYQKDKKKRTSD